MARKKTTEKPTTAGRSGKPIRLQKILAAAGFDSRRGCEELILSGAVTVNGEVVHTLPAFADPDTDDIRVEGRRIRPERKVYFLLNKPKNVICTSRDPQGRPKAVDLAPCKERVFCVGRLDAETTGLILLTNDAELANRLTHPRYELPKTYEVTIRGRMEGDDIEKLKKGVWLSEGKTERAAVRILRRTPLETILEISIRQGLNRQVRRSFARLGYKVKALKRTRIGEIELKGIPRGQCKPPSPAQLAYLYRATGLKTQRKAPSNTKNTREK
ncbi:MAG: rRNA pseudouridine synthase [Planctomycetes bacterium]|jgi:23S rRNA pseudouridine2605 synthase|nr:rRNA pseudouridine synthase [Planctomycetota bacterium]